MISQLQLPDNKQIEKSQSLTDQFLPIRRSESAQFKGVAPDKIFNRLSFTHLAAILPCKDPLQRAFYETMAIRGTWSVRELQRQIDSNYYERSGWSQKPKKVRLLAAYNVDYDDLSYCMLFKGIRDLTRFCKDAVMKGDLVDEEEFDDYSKGVAAKTKEVVKELQDRKTFFYDSNSSNTQDFYISDFVNVKYH